MKLGKKTKVALGLITIWPWIYMPLFFGFVMLFMAKASTTGRGGHPPTGLMVGFGVVFVLHALTILSSIALMVFYLFYLYKARHLEDSNTRLMWTLLLVLVGFLAMPVFFYLYVWPDQPEPPDEDEGGEPLA